MPELPEVETIASSLRNSVELPFTSSDSLKSRPGVVGRVIKNAQVLWDRSIALPVAGEFVSRIAGQRICDVQRRGKYLTLKLERDWLLVHLRMSGDIRVEPMTCSTVQPHDRVYLNFQDDSRMVFNDTRKFGRLWLVEDPQDILGKLGVEPLSEDLDDEAFFHVLHICGRSIKSFLLDQKLLAGLGNIYTDEALFLAGIHPLQKSNTLEFQQSTTLLRAIRQVLAEGIRRNGASIDWVYRGGDFQNYFNVYQRTGKPCEKCGGVIERMVVGQRGTHYCPNCQKLT